MRSEYTQTGEYIPKGVCFQVVKFEENFALLKNANSEIWWPIEEIPQNTKIGHEVRLKMVKAYPTDSDSNNKNEKYAALRQLLEELIN